MKIKFDNTNKEITILGKWNKVLRRETLAEGMNRIQFIGFVDTPILDVPDCRSILIHRTALRTPYQLLIQYSEKRKCFFCGGFPVENGETKVIFEGKKIEDFALYQSNVEKDRCFI